MPSAPKVKSNEVTQVNLEVVAADVPFVELVPLVPLEVELLPEAPELEFELEEEFEVELPYEPIGTTKVFKAE